MSNILISACFHDACSKKLTCQFEQKWTNMEKTYELDKDGELVFKSEVDQQEIINSNRVDTLAEMYDKYMTGQLQIPQNKENGEVIDFTETFGKDKMQLVMDQTNHFNQLLQKYNLPETTTPQEFNDYISQQMQFTEMQMQQTEKENSNNETN